MTFANWKAYLTLYLLIIVILSASYQQQQKQMIIDFGISTRLANIMTGADRKDNYYVDINVHDPYVGSPTLGLEMLDWTGINLSPNHYIMQKFNRARSHQQNVLAFIGQQSRFSALQYSSSQKSNDGKSIEKYMVPEISLSELCIKYYQKRPNLIVIGANSNANQVLFGNNWGDIRCHPDVFLISNIQEQNYKNSSIQPPKQNYNFLLNTKSYVKSQIQMGNYSLYIRNNVMTQYMSNYERIQKYLQNQNIITLDKLVQQMNKVFYQQIDIMNIQSSPVLLYYVKKNQIITQSHIRKINHQKLQSMKSKQGSLPPRALPFILINYRSEQNYFILNTCDFLINKIIVNPNNLTQNISFINVNINSHGEYRQKLSVFLINYQSNIQWTPKISVINQVCVKYNQTTLQEDYVPPSLQKNLTLQQSSAVNQNSSRGLQLESIIFQTLFSVTFLCMFLIVATIMIVFLCRSLIQEQKIKDLIIQNSKMNLSQIISSPV